MGKFRVIYYITVNNWTLKQVASTLKNSLHSYHVAYHLHWFRGSLSNCLRGLRLFNIYYWVIVEILFGKYEIIFGLLVESIFRIEAKSSIEI